MLLLLQLLRLLGLDTSLDRVLPRVRVLVLGPDGLCTFKRVRSSEHLHLSVAFGGGAGDFLRLVATLIAVELRHVVLLLLLRVLNLVLCLVSDRRHAHLLRVLPHLSRRLQRCVWRLLLVTHLHWVQLMLRLRVVVVRNLRLAPPVLQVLELLFGLAGLEHERWLVLAQLLLLLLRWKRLLSGVFAALWGQTAAIANLR